MKKRFLKILAVFCLAGAPARQAWSQDWFKLGNQYQAARQLPQAEAAYRKGLAENQHSPELFHALGNCLVLQGRIPQALDAYRQSLMINPGNTALAGYVRTLEQRQRVQSQGLEGDELDQALELARMRLEHREYAQAEREFSDILRSSPKNGLAYEGLGEAHYYQGRFAQAKAAMDKGLSYEPDHAKLLQFSRDYLSGDMKDRSGAGQADRIAPLWRSALLPGWGQVYNGQKRKGFLTGGTCLALLGGVVYTYYAAEQNFRDYSGLGADSRAGDFDATYQQAAQQATANHLLYVLFSGLYAYNLIDAAASAQAAPLAVGLHRAPGGGAALAVSARKSF